MRWSGGVAAASDWAIWVRKDYAQLHAGAECAEAVDVDVFSRSNVNDVGWDGVVADHGGRLYEQADGSGTHVVSELVLQGEVDTHDPLNATDVDEEPT